MNHIERHLGDGRTFLVGNRFTVADIVVGYALHLGDNDSYQLHLGGKYKPLTRSYLARLRERDAFKAAREEQAASLAQYQASNITGS
jgi:glutathione S-transferase